MEDLRRVDAVACGIGTARSSSSTASHACSTGVGQGHKEIGDSGERPSYDHAQQVQVNKRKKKKTKFL